MMLAYSAVLVVALVVSSPWWLVRMATTERYRAGLWERLGFVPARLREAVAGLGARRVVWVHAVSVGEVLAASRLVVELQEALETRVRESGPGAPGGAWRVVISTTTRTGQALARERFGAARVFYMPLDFGWAVRAYLRVLRPAALVLMESELWPRMLHECERAAIPVAVVNARVSDRSFARAMRVRFVWGLVLRKVSLWLAQSEEDARRLRAMGARAEAVRVGGNLKYDVRAPKESRVAELIKEAAAGRPIVVAGSTVGGTRDHYPDEEGWLITIWGGRARNEKKAMLVLAPRHPERFQAVWKDATEFPAVRATQLLKGEEGTQHSLQVRESGDQKPEIVILDTIGDLAAVYGIADVAFVGGSLIKRGGHNPLEPAQFGVPVLMGPSYENFRDVVETMKSADAIVITEGVAQLPTDVVDKGNTLRPDLYVMRDSLEAEMMRLLTNREAAKAMGERGHAVFEAQQGATKRAVEAIVALVGSANPGAKAPHSSGPVRPEAEASGYLDRGSL